MCSYGELRRLQWLGLRCQDEREGEGEQEGVQGNGRLTLSAVSCPSEAGVVGVDGENGRRNAAAAGKVGDDFVSSGPPGPIP